MAEQNIQIKDLAGNLLFPKTKGAVVINNAGENLGGVEAGAQVNKLEGIKIDGVELTIKNKIAEIIWRFFQPLLLIMFRNLFSGFLKKL